VFEKRKQAKLEAIRQRQAVTELRRLADELPDAEGVISPDDLAVFFEFVGTHPGSLSPDIWRDVRLGLAEGGYFVEAETDLFLRKDVLDPDEGGETNFGGNL
jgi:hypothetical protein